MDRDSNSNKRVFAPYKNGRSASNYREDNLPEWDLSDLYSDPQSLQLKNDITKLRNLTKSFSQKYKNKLSSLSSLKMLDCVKMYEKITQMSGRLISYAALRFYKNTTDVTRGQFLSEIQEKLTEINSDLVFFSLEFNTIDEKILKNLMQESSQLARYEPAFRRMRAMKPFQLSDELENFLNDQSVVGASSWNKLFDETMASLTFEIDKKILTLEETLNLISDPRRLTRKKAAIALATKLGSNINLFSRITNTIIKEKSIEDKWRKFPNAQFPRHLANDVEPEVVEALRNAVVDAYPRTAHRYYKLKAKWMGLKKLEVWDRNAPLPRASTKLFYWDEAKHLVLEAYSDFHPQMARIAEPFFEKGWIDAKVTKGKAPGAFAHPTVTSLHPYILLNYLGKPRDVMTLAHELGHGIHQCLAAEQGEILSSTPLTLAETASVFGEMLTFNKLLSKCKGKKERKHLLASKVEDMINTVIRQISFYDFECRLHKARDKGELTPDEINNIWLSVSHESLGDCFSFFEGYETFWSYVPHFIHSPFYVYAYAFGDGLVNALYSRFEAKLPGFEEKYLAMLSSGGSKHHSELLKPFGLDASDPTFWSGGLDVISTLIDKLEALE